MMMESKFSGEGIHSLESDDDLMSAMPRELVERGQVGESAAPVWQDLKRERSLHMTAIDREPESGVLTELPAFVPTAIQEELPALLLVRSSQKKQKSSSVCPTAEDAGSQMLMFA